MRLVDKSGSHRGPMLAKSGDRAQNHSDRNPERTVGVPRTGAFALKPENIVLILDQSLKRTYQDVCRLSASGIKVHISQRLRKPLRHRVCIESCKISEFASLTRPGPCFSACRVSKPQATA